MQVNVLECGLFAFGIAATLILMVKIQHIGVQNNSSQFELEHILLVVTQSGVFLYSMFQVYFKLNFNWIIFKFRLTKDSLFFVCLMEKNRGHLETSIFNAIY